MSPKGGLYAASPRNDERQYFDFVKKINFFRHSTFRAGQPVRCAGIFFANGDGKIIQLSADSGHYTPSAQQLFDATLLLLQNGFIDEECRIIIPMSDKILSAGEIKREAELKVQKGEARHDIAEAQVRSLRGDEGREFKR